MFRHSICQARLVRQYANPRLMILRRPLAIFRQGIYRLFGKTCFLIMRPQYGLLNDGFERSRVLRGNFRLTRYFTWWEDFFHRDTLCFFVPRTFARFRSSLIEAKMLPLGC